MEEEEETFGEHVTFFCDNCRRRYFEEAEMLTHQRRCRRRGLRRDILCGRCMAMFTDLQTFIEHERVCKKTCRFRCGHAPFSSASACLRHEQLHCRLNNGN